jgi:hypothetical protein
MMIPLLDLRLKENLKVSVERLRRRHVGCQIS